MKSHSGVVVGLAGIGVLLFMVVVGITFAGPPQHLKAGWFDDQVEEQETAGDLQPVTSSQNEDELFEVSHLAPAPEQTVNLHVVYPTALGWPQEQQDLRYNINVTSSSFTNPCTWQYQGGLPDGSTDRCTGSATGSFTLRALPSIPNIVPIHWVCSRQTPAVGGYTQGPTYAEAESSYDITVSLDDPLAAEEVLACRWVYEYSEVIPAPRGT